MWLAAAAEAPAGASDGLVAVIGGVVIAALGTLGVVLREVIVGRNARAATPPPPAATVTASPHVDVVALAADVAVLKDWRKTTREADDIHDRTLRKVVDDVEDLTAWQDREHPGWRP